MEYSYELIHTTDTLSSHASMYSCVLVEARQLMLQYENTRCFLDGRYMFCLSDTDRIICTGGSLLAYGCRFLPYFINVNLNPKMIDDPDYSTLQAQHQYPDFHLFRQRDETYIGIIPLTETEYSTAYLYFQRAERHISEHETNYTWSCQARGDLFSILHIAESAYLGVESGMGWEILQYIKDNISTRLTLQSLCDQFHTNRTTLTNTIKEITGLSPMAYVLEERLTQVLPYLLFTSISVAQLAEMFGFMDDNYFIRVFKKKYGKPPMQYRTDARAARP